MEHLSFRAGRMHLENFFNRLTNPSLPGLTPLL
jgi:hypothetical protein